jgi:flagellar basal-body rod protein FlgB
VFGNSLTPVLLQKALDGTWQRQKAISENIANHETPGYKSKNISFENLLEREMNQVHFSSEEEKDRSLRKIRDVKINVSTDFSTSERLDGNNVNLDVENIQMAKTQIQYQYLTRCMTDFFSRLRYAISEGRK